MIPLFTQGGYTIAVMGNGPDICYPQIPCLDTVRVLGSGCELGIASPVDNIHAMVFAAEDFAREG